jgi:zinc protease
MPGPAPLKPFRAPRFVRRTLANGIDAWIAPWKTLPLVSVRLLIPAGTADDPRGKSGLSTLTATLLDKGTTARTATELAQALELLGVTLATRASADDTSIAFSTVVRNLEPVLKLLTEALDSPRHDPIDFDRERGLQLAGLIQGPDSVNWIAARAFSLLLYGSDHPYGNPAAGYRATVEGLTLDDVRRFHATHVRPQGATLIVVGDVEPDAVVATLESTLGGWQPRGEAGGPRPAPASEAALESGAIAFVDKPGAVQSVVQVGRRWVDRSDPRYFPARLGNRILGGDFLSRLNQNLREKNGFTYGAGSAFRFHRSGSLWIVSTQVRTDATAPALKEVLGELDALTGGTKPFTEDEIAKARAADARSFPGTFESPGSIAGVLGEMAEFQLPPDYVDTFLDRLQATPPEAIGATMSEVIAPGARLALIVGDRQKVEPKLRALGYTQIRFVTPDGVPAGE